MTSIERYDVDVDVWFAEFAEEWRDYSEGEAATDVLREAFIRDTASELGREIRDWGDYVESDFEVDVLRRKARA